MRIKLIARWRNSQHRRALRRFKRRYGDWQMSDNFDEHDLARTIRVMEYLADLEEELESYPTPDVG